METWKHAVAGFVVPLFWLVILSVALWLTRRFFPRAERTLFAPVGVVLRRLLRRERKT